MENGILKKSLLSLRKVEIQTGPNRIFRTMAVYKHYILAFDSAGSKSDDCYIFDTQKATTTRVTTEINLANRTGYSLCHWKDNIFVIYGGSTLGVGQIGSGISPQEVTNRIDFLFVIETESRVSIEIKPCHLKDVIWRNSYHSAQIYQDNMYILGGKERKMQKENTLEVWKFDLNVHTWSFCQTTGDKPMPRHSPGSALLEDKLYLFGGQSKESKNIFNRGDLFGNEKANDLFVLDLKTMTWKEIQSDNFLPLSKLSADLRGEVVEGKIFISTPSFEEFLIYDPIKSNLTKSEAISPKEGFMIRCYQDHSILFRIVNKTFGSGLSIEIQDLRILKLK